MKAKLSAAVAAKVLGKSEAKKDDCEDEDEEDAGLVSAAEDLLRAVASKSAKGVAAALRAAKDLA